SYVDAQIGKVLNALEANGLADNTIVVVWGDHGWQLGDHRVWGKHTLTERSLRSPLIIAAPQKKGGSVSEQVVSTIDIYPTLMELCGVSMQHQTDGSSLAGIINASKKRKRDEVAYGY